MSGRRDVLSYIGTGAMGAMLGYYVGARELLGIQSQDRRPPAPTTQSTQQQTANPTEEPPAEQTDTEPTDSSVSSASDLAESGFPRFQYDNQNRGFVAGTEGPAQSPSERWRVGTDGNNHTTPAIHDGTAYFGGGSGDQNQSNGVYAVDIETGEQQWQFTRDRSFQSSVAVGEDRVYIADDGGTLYALDPTDGSQLWSAQFGGASYTAAPLLTGGNVYVGRPEAGGVVGFDSQSGEQVWLFETDSGVRRSPAVAGGTLYLGTEAGRVFAVALSDGSLQWEVATAGEVTGAPAVAGETVFVPTRTGAVHALSASDGTEQWTTETNQQIRSSPAVDESTVYVGTGQLFDTPGTLYALNRESGSVEWSFEPESSYGGREGAIIRAPTVGSERVYFGVDANKVYAVNADDGSKSWQFDTAVVLASPAIHDGTLYTGTDNNSVIALE